MKRLWDWHNRGTTTDNIDSFIANLQKANSQGGILRKDQMLEDLDISTSAAVLAVIAAHHPDQTNKIVTAALEMNRYLDTYYPNKSNITGFLSNIFPNSTANHGSLLISLPLDAICI